MRVIKFRGRRVDGGAWVYGHYSVRPTELIGTGHYIYLAKANTDVKVISETVGQFTGFKDKNGVDIYEGDILKTHYGLYNSEGIGKVIMSNDGCWTVSFKESGVLPTDPVHGCLRNQDYLKMFLPVLQGDMEVIGNIHTKDQRGDKSE